MYAETLSKDHKNKLHRAITQGDKKLVEQLLLNNDLNNKTSYDNLLHLAIAKLNDSKIIALLLKKINNAHVKNCSGQIPLDIAVNLRNLDIAKLLLNKEAHTAGELQLSIYNAVKNGDKKMVSLLFNYFINHNILINPEKMLAMAIKNGKSELMERFLSIYKFDEKHKLISRSVLLKNGQQYKKIANCLLHHGFMISLNDAKDNHLVFSIIAKGWTKVVEKFLLLKANVNKVDTLSGLSPLFVACLNQRYKTVKMLVNFSADVNLENAKKINYDIKAVKKFRFKTSETIEKKTPLFCAVALLDHRLIEILLDGADLKNNQYFFSLIDTVLKGNDKLIFKMLVEHKSDINATDSQKFTLLHKCLNHDNSNMHENIQFLLQRGANINAQNQNCETPLHIACCRNITVPTFFIYNAEVNIKDAHGKTPLHVACALNFNNITLIETLLNNNADINATDDDNKTPLFYALEKHEYSPVSLNFKSIRTFMYHIIKLKLAGLKIIRQNLELVHQIRHRYCSAIYDEQIKSFEADCKSEIDELKKENIWGQKISFYHLLTGNIHYLSKFANNQGVNETLKCQACSDKFHIYINVIKNRFQEALKRKQVLKDAWRYSFLRVCSGLPDLCTDKVFSFFNIDELKDFIKTIERIIESNKSNLRKIKNNQNKKNMLVHVLCDEKINNKKRSNSC